MEMDKSEADYADSQMVAPEGEISGWADAMAKILGSKKPKKKKMLILSRAKKDYEVRRSEQIQVQEEDTEVPETSKAKPTPTKPLLKRDRKKLPKIVDTQLEIVKSNPDAPDVVFEDLTVKTDASEAVAEPVAKKKKKVTIKESESTSEDLVSLKAQRKQELKRKRLQKELENLNRSKPDPFKDKEKENQLRRVATKGVVELFNAVNIQKQAVGKKLKEAPKSAFKQDKILAQTKDLFQEALEKVTKKNEEEVEEDED